jgi:hypothetical protein
VTGPLADRYRVVAPLPAVGGVPRDLAVDIATDAQVELSRFAAGGPVPPAFELGARRYQSARHACLAPILDLAVPAPGEGSPAIVEAHADGPRLDPAAHLPRPAALLACADIADAVATLHGAGLVHGALGSEAVATDAVGRPMVMGAGWRSLQAAALGAPEPALGPDDDVRGIGRVLYALVCGRAPDPVPIAPANVAPGVDPALNGLILALLSDDPMRPPPTAAAVALRLRDLAGVGTRVVLPPGPPGPPAAYPAYALGEPPRRIPRRGYSDAGLISAAIALAIGGVLAAYGFANLENDGQDTVTSVRVSTVERVVTVPATDAGTFSLPDLSNVPGLSDLTQTDSGILTVPTEATDTGGVPLTVTDVVTDTDPFAIPTFITVTEQVTETVTQSDTVFTEDTFSDEFTDFTEPTDTQFTETGPTDTTG